jgi:hypothetical protein
MMKKMKIMLILFNFFIKIYVFFTFFLKISLKIDVFFHFFSNFFHFFKFHPPPFKNWRLKLDIE